MTTTWILIANATEAHLYQSPKAKLFNGMEKLELVCEFAHPDGRKKDIDLVSDRLGHNGHGTMIESSDLKQFEAERFARELAQSLESSRTSNSFQDLIVIAPPSFHGLLNKHFNEQLQGLVSVNVEKDYTKANERQLLSNLQGYL